MPKPAQKVAEPPATVEPEAAVQAEVSPAEMSFVQAPPSVGAEVSQDTEPAAAAKPEAAEAWPAEVSSVQAPPSQAAEVSQDTEPAAAAEPEAAKAAEAAGEAPKDPTCDVDFATLIHKLHFGLGLR